MAFKLEIGFFARNAFSARIDFLTRIGFLSRIGFSARNGFLARNSFSARNGFLARNSFSARNGFFAEMAVRQKLLFSQKYFCQIWSGFLARNVFFKWICLMYYFSKYWKLWLAFNGWKLSCLFFKFLVENFQAASEFFMMELRSEKQMTLSFERTRKSNSLYLLTHSICKSYKNLWETKYGKGAFNYDVRFLGR